MIKFFKMKGHSLGDNGTFECIDIIKETESGMTWIAEVGSWSLEDNHFWADAIVDALLEKFGEF